jgi:hypothetical protein
MAAVLQGSGSHAKVLLVFLPDAVETQVQAEETVSDRLWERQFGQKQALNHHKRLPLFPQLQAAFFEAFAWLETYELKFRLCDK